MSAPSNYSGTAGIIKAFRIFGYEIPLDSEGLVDVRAFPVPEDPRLAAAREAYLAVLNSPINTIDMKLHEELYEKLRDVGVEL